MAKSSFDFPKDTKSTTLARMQRGTLAICFAIAMVGCGGGVSDTTVASQFPTGSVRSWFVALDAGNHGASLDLTDTTGLLVLVAVENDLSPRELTTALRRGVSDRSSVEYLTGFGASLREFYGEPLARISVDGFTRLGDGYAIVEVNGTGAATILVRQNPVGVWQVDLVGTVGPVFTSQLQDLLGRADGSPVGDELRELFANSVIPALEAVSLYNPEDLDLAAAILRMKRGVSRVRA